MYYRAARAPNTIEFELRNTQNICQVNLGITVCKLVRRGDEGGYSYVIVLCVRIRCTRGLGYIAATGQMVGPRGIFISTDHILGLDR